MVKYLCADNLQDIKHGFFGRQGGVSRNDYNSLNSSLSIGDNIDNVNENRNCIVRSLGGRNTILQTMHQVHGVHVETVGKNLLTTMSKADALVTHDLDVMLGVLTADCAPILFCDAVNGVIGAAHAGWRGAFGGILEKTVRKMEYIGAEAKCIHMAIGPCIGQKNYEIDILFYKQFLEQDTNNKDFFLDIKDKDSNWLFDLSEYLLRRGEKLNLGSVTGMIEDTYSQENNFFSHRRHMVKHNHGNCGRQLSVIMMQP